MRHAAFSLFWRRFCHLAAYATRATPLVDIDEGAWSRHFYFLLIGGRTGLKQDFTILPPDPHLVQCSSGVYLPVVLLDLPCYITVLVPSRALAPLQPTTVPLHTRCASVVHFHYFAAFSGVPTLPTYACMPRTCLPFSTLTPHCLHADVCT